MQPAQCLRGLTVLFISLWVTQRHDFGNVEIIDTPLIMCDEL